MMQFNNPSYLNHLCNQLCTLSSINHPWQRNNTAFSHRLSAITHHYALLRINVQCVLHVQVENEIQRWEKCIVWAAALPALKYCWVSRLLPSIRINAIVFFWKMFFVPNEDSSYETLTYFCQVRVDMISYSCIWRAALLRMCWKVCFFLFGEKPAAENLRLLSALITTSMPKNYFIMRPDPCSFNTKMTLLLLSLSCVCQGTSLGDSVSHSWHWMWYNECVSLCFSWTGIRSPLSGISRL